MSHLIGAGSRIFLSGGGDETQSFLLDNFFLQNIPENGNILYIPLALRGHRLFEGAEEWFTSLLSSHKREDISITTLQNADSTIPLDSFDAVYIGGGNTWSLLKELKESHFNTKLQDYIALPHKMIYGGSAGAIILGAKISCQNDQRVESFEDENGLDLLSGKSVTCHYEGSGEQETLVANWLSAHQTELLALSEDNGIIISDDGTETVLGTGHASFTEHSKKSLA